MTCTRPFASRLLPLFAALAVLAGTSVRADALADPGNARQLMLGADSAPL